MLKSAAALTCLLLMTLPAAAQTMPEPVNADDLKWVDAPDGLPKGAKIAVLAGDPTKEGPFIVRVRMPNRYRIAAHNHPTDEYITVLGGRLFVGMGDKLDTDKGKRLGRGGFMHMPANMNHYVYTRRGTVIQVNGMGPFAINYVDAADDPRKR